MRVTLFARVDTTLNPYILLYKRTLERQGIKVYLEREFNLKWLITRGGSDAIHFHWIEATYKPLKWNTRFDLANQLMNGRFVQSLRGVLRLTGFFIALLWAKLQGKVIVYTVHNLKPNFDETLVFGILNQIAHRVLLPLTNHIHVHNHYTRKVLETDYRRTEGVAVIPHGNYVGHYLNQISRLEARQQLGLPDAAFVYLFLGLVRPYKGVEDLMQAFEKLESPQGRLLIVGRVSKASYKEEILNQSRNNSTIKVIPEFVPDEALQLYMNACDICVLPYKDITTSGAAVLALSFGRPVIAPAITSFPELITAETGILYDPSQPDALLAALQQARQRSWSEAEILDYVHQFDWDKLGSRLVTLYQHEE